MLDLVKLVEKPECNLAEGSGGDDSVSVTSRSESVLNHRVSMILEWFDMLLGSSVWNET